MRLKRGSLLFIAGGGVVAASAVIFAYFTFSFATALFNENRHSIGPADSLTITQFIFRNATEGMYIVGIPEFSGEPGLKVIGPDGQIIVDKNLDSPVVAETFDLSMDGNYTLILANPSPDGALEAAVVIGDRETIIESGLTTSPEVFALSFNALLFAGISMIVAGAVITILDRRRINKMKQFGDTRDLV